MTNLRQSLSGLSVVLLYLALSACGGQNGRPVVELPAVEDLGHSTEGEAFMQFDTLFHDFGTIIEGERVLCYFEYQNRGDAALLINSVEATCGCTTPGWSDQPLSPGASERLEIVFDASGRSGEQRKVVTVRTNASNSELRLNIRAHVKKSVN